jgi:hypothetical protein
MSPVVEAACPGCKKTLRIPAEWIHQAFRCKHCGMIIAARASASAPKASAAPTAPIPVAAARPDVGAPRAVVAPAVSGSAAFANLDEGGIVTSRRRARGGWWKAGLFAVCVLGIIGVALYASWSQLKQLAQKSPVLLATNEEEEDGAKGIGNQGDKSPMSHKKDAQHRGVASKERGKKSGPARGDGALTSAVFPRRGLVVSVNNYLYLNPINYGSSGPRTRNVHSLLDRFTNGLRIPREQMFELSDAAPQGKARPPVKPVIEKVIGDFLDTSRPQDRIILLLIAHTVELGEEPYIIPLDGYLETKETLIPLAWLCEKLAKCPARQKLLIVDTCRYDPTRGMERPGSGVMGGKLDAMLQTPPPGVEVWSACIAGQQSYEFDSSANGSVNGGLFLDCIYESLLHGIEGTIQRPEEAINFKPLVDKVNARMRTELTLLNLKQESRLAGQPPEEGAAYDPKQPPAPKVAVEVPTRAKEGVASQPLVASILKEIDVPPLKLTHEDMLLRAESMPPFDAKVLDQYRPDGEMTPFREAVEKARKTLHAQLKGKRLREEWDMMGDDNGHKAFVKGYQEKEVAGTMRELEEALEDLKQAGKDRKEEKSKRWQANYDYIYARLEAQLAYLYEYDSLLGEMRKDLPEKGPNGWRVASQKKQQGDATGQKYGRDAVKIQDKLIKEHPGTPWEVLAKRDKLSNLGLKWQPNK